MYKMVMGSIIVLNSIVTVSPFVLSPSIRHYEKIMSRSEPVIALMMKRRDTKDIFNEFRIKRNTTEEDESNEENKIIISEVDKTLIRIYVYGVLWYYCLIKLFTSSV